MKWKKIGLIIKPNSLKFAFSHAMIPTPEHLEGSIYRVYFSARNNQNQSYINLADIDLTKPTQALRYCENLLLPGELGCFDDNGVTPSCVINLNASEKALYYIGWNPGSTVRMHLFGGLAISKDGGKTFQRWSRAPIIERCSSDPYLNTAPWVVKTEKEYRMYYVCGTEWIHKDLPRYHIRIAFSNDGKNWKRDGKVCIDFKDNTENALARPYVIYDEGKWKMWFSHKGDAYRIGYAESEDGINWTRMDDCVGINVSQEGFDCDMIEYAAVVKHEDRYYMFYNGNNYGFDGIGVAVSE